MGRNVCQIKLTKSKCCEKTLGEKKIGTLNKGTTENINTLEWKKRGEMK